MGVILTNNTFFLYLLICFVLFSLILCYLTWLDAAITLWRAMKTDLSGNFMATIGGEKMAKLDNFCRTKVY